MQILIIQFHSNNSFVSTNSVSAPKSSSSVETEDFSSYAHGTTGLQISPFINEYHGYGSGYYCDQSVRDGPYGSHTKVLYVRDAQGGKNTWSVHYLDNPLSQGIIEFSLYLNPGSSSTSPNYHFLKFQTFNDEIAFEFRFNLKNGDVQYSDGLAWSGNILDLDIYKWYRYEIGFDVSIGIYDLTCTEEVSGIQQVFIEDISYKNSVSIEEMYIGTDVADYSGNSRWDDFRFEEYLDPITINSPENKVYRSHVDGYYRGTYTFEDDYDGYNPVGFNVHEDAGHVKVVGAKEGHVKVVEMYDAVNYAHTELHNDFLPKTSGTVEFWILDEDVSDTFSIRLLDDAATSVWGEGIGWIQIWQDTLRYMDDSGWHVIPKAISDDTWYHIKIEFECTSDTWRFYIDGEVFGDFTFLNDIDNIGQIYFATRGADYSYKCYVDAIGYEWDPNYNIGDNFPIEGYYPGTYGFEDEEDETSGDTIRFVDFNSYPTCEVISEMDGHNKVLKLTKDANWSSIYDTINDQSEGTVEWWVRTPQSYVSHRLILYDGTTQGIIIYFHEDGLIYEHHGTTAAFTTYEANSWTHVRVDFECLTVGDPYEGLEADKYYVYINGERFGPFAFKTGVSAIDKVFFDAGGVSNTRYMDAVGYSWDDYYDPGDNRHEGLLLDFTPDDLANMEYTLNDGQTQTTVPIYGDTAIPIPETGDYTLTVSGDGYASSSVSFNTKISTGFLYAQSSVSHTWDSGTWTDVDAAINSVENPGEYFVIYTATYQITNDLPFIVAEGSGWVQLVVDGVGIGKTKRMYDSLDTSRPDNIYGTLIVADVVTLDSGGVKAQIQFYPVISDKMTLLDRSICAIPLKEGYEYVNSMTSHSWADEEIEEDPDIYLESLTGDYFAIYTSSFMVTEGFPFLGVHSNGWAEFSDRTIPNDLRYTRRQWEFPAYLDATAMFGTLLVADVIHLENTDLYVNLRLLQREGWGRITIGARSLILIPLANDYIYEKRTDTSQDLNQDIVFEDINTKCFVMYTATNFIEREALFNNPQGWGWTAYNNGIDTLEYTKRYYQYSHGYGSGMRKTRYNVEILDLFREDIKVEYYWDPFTADEEFYLEYRSMILIPFY